MCAADYEYAKEANNGAWVFYEDVKKEFDKYRIEHSICEDTVEELQEVNKELLEALEWYVERDEQMATHGTVPYSAQTINNWRLLARAAIAKAIEVRNATRRL
jgi:phage pi2 protein 07